MNRKKNRIKELVRQLNEYRSAYYNENKSIVSDKEYDSLFDELCRLEETTGLVYSNSPTKTVGYDVVSKLKKVKHNHPLLSLGKTTDINEFADYFDNKPVMLMAKLDGLTCSISYKKGKMVLAESRGNGEIGEDITHNARTFVNLPLNIPFDGELIVDGECIIDYETFAEINRRENTEYKNPRNLVSGTVRQLDSKVAAARKVKFIAWKLKSVKDSTGKELPVSDNYRDSFTFLKDVGFDVVNHFLIDDKEEIPNAVDTLKTTCDDVPIDGIVGVFDDDVYGKSLGVTSHHPKNALAFKFYQEENETTLLDIEWSTSRTGMVNPVAVFEPVEIDGTTVTRASLCNVSVIADLQLGIGDTITVIKSNQIIPKITGNLTRSGTYKIPILCPDCGSVLFGVCNNGRSTLWCTNPSCKAKIVDRFTNFVSREGMNVVGLSREKLIKLIDSGFLNIFSDLYTLVTHKHELEKLEGFGKASVDKLLNAIEESRHCNMQNAIVAIGIPGVGKSTARTISKYCNDKYGSKVAFMQFIKSSSKGFDWTDLDDIGAASSDSINKYISDNYNELFLLSLMLDINVDKDVDDHCNECLAGKSICITGKLTIYKNREALVNEIESLGGKVVSGVTAKTDYLITNDKESGSSKNLKAAKYGTAIINEEEFVRLCGKEF